MQPFVESLELPLDELTFGPGADDIVVPAGPKINALSPNDPLAELDIPAVVKQQEEEATKKPEDEDKKETPKPVAATTEALGLENEVVAFSEAITGTGESEETTTETTTTADKGRPKVDKTALVGYLKDKIEKKEFSVYDDYDEKTPIEEYLSKMPEKDLYQLLDSNWEAKEKALREQTPQEFYDALPPEAKAVAEYAMQGGRDWKTFYGALAKVEEARNLDPADENDQVIIAREYLQVTTRLTPSQIEEQVNDWKDAGKIDKKAAEFKPQLDDYQKQRADYYIKQQEQYNRQQQELAQYYTQNVYEALKPGDLNGIKLDKKTRETLYTGLTTLQQSPISGKQVNLLGALLEQVQYSETPDYKLLAEATYLLSDPEGYRNAIRQQASNKKVEETVRMLKTAQSSNTGNTIIPETEGGVKVKKLIKPRNAFER